MRRAVSFYNAEAERYSREGHALPAKDFVSYDATQIKWDKALFNSIEKSRRFDFDPSCICEYAYRPFFKQYFYRDQNWSWSFYRVEELFPAGQENVALCITDGNNPSCLITDTLFGHDYVGHSQCFPLYWYENGKAEDGLFDSKRRNYTRHDAITDEALSVFRETYPHAFLGRFKKDGGEELNKEDIFYYVYGILHSPEYRERFVSNLKKELPRIPLADDFAAFSRAGRKLAQLHLNYETVEPWGFIEEESKADAPGRTKKMKFGKCKKTDENPKGVDRTVLHVSEETTLRGIPEEAYEYAVNGRSAIEWLIDRYQVTTDTKGGSGIVNDPNEYSDDPRYIVDLVKRVVTVSMETMEIIHMLPPLREKEQPASWPMAWKA